MATETRIVARTLGSLFHAGTTAGLTDGQLLERFATGTGERASRRSWFWSNATGRSCCVPAAPSSVTSTRPQDAFQADLPASGCKGRSVWVRDSLGPWLLRVARRVAVRARAESIRQTQLNQHYLEIVTERRKTEEDPELARDVREEIDRLADRFRRPIVLCDLEDLPTTRPRVGRSDGRWRP